MALKIGEEFSMAKHHNSKVKNKNKVRSETIIEVISPVKSKSIKD
jgi:hypothetical protein